MVALAAAGVLLAALAGCGNDGATGASAAGTSNTAATARSSGTTPVRCPDSPRPVSISTPTPWQVIGRTGPEGLDANKEVRESRVTITNPNPVPVQMKTVVLVGGALVAYGVPTKNKLRPDGGTDWSIVGPPPVAAGASVELLARVKLPSPTTRVVYGYARLSAPPALAQACEIPVTGAEPFRLLGPNPDQVVTCDLYVSLSANATC